MIEEYKIYKRTDKNIRNQVLLTKSDPTIMFHCEKVELYYKMREYNVILNSILRKLNQYLLQIRINFPRFFILSNEDLLAILSEVKKIPDI